MKVDKEQILLPRGGHPSCTCVYTTTPATHVFIKVCNDFWCKWNFAVGYKDEHVTRKLCQWLLPCDHAVMFVGYCFYSGIRVFPGWCVGVKNEEEEVFTECQSAAGLISSSCRMEGTSVQRLLGESHLLDVCWCVNVERWSLLLPTAEQSLKLQLTWVSFLFSSELTAVLHNKRRSVNFFYQSDSDSVPETLSDSSNTLCVFTVRETNTHCFSSDSVVPALLSVTLWAYLMSNSWKPSLLCHFSPHSWSDCESQQLSAV